MPFKPDVCEEFGCEERHPCFSRDGMAGPWRCREHDLAASRLTPEAGRPDHESPVSPDLDPEPDPTRLL